MSHILQVVRIINSIRFSLISIVFLLLISSVAYSQDIVYAHHVLDTLCSKTMWGRGVNRDGMYKAARFIENEFRKNGVSAYNGNYSQEYLLQSNTIDQVKLTVNDTLLNPGADYVVAGLSPSCRINAKNISPVYVRTMEDYKNARLADWAGRVIILDGDAFDYYMLNRTIVGDLEKNRIVPRVLMLQGRNKNLMFPVGRKKGDFPVVVLKNRVFTQPRVSFSLSVESTLHPQYKAENIIGYVKGKVQPDTFFVFIAHYDHLGAMGDQVYFPGASDNASSICVLMDLARHYALTANQPDYSILFLAVSGEELGLFGSKHYASNPFFPLSKMKFLVNMDMNGTGSGGFHLVNGVNEPKASALIQHLNRRNYYFPQVVIGEGSCNSDHCAFYERGVPSLFVFTSGCEFNEYHNMYDISVPLTKYESVFRMLQDFVKEYR